MKKYNIVEEILMDMHDNKETMPTMDEVVSDEVIMEKLKKVEDLEQQVSREKRTLLIGAAFSKRKSAVEYLIKQKVDVNKKEKAGFTALHAAVMSLNSYEKCKRWERTKDWEEDDGVQILRMLLENGADVNAQDAWGNTPIMRATHLLPEDIFRILLEYGADVSIKNYYGVSARDEFAAYPNILNVFREYC